MAYTAAVITISDKGSRGERVDTSGPAICEILKEAGFEVCYTAILPDEYGQIKDCFIDCADRQKIALIVSTGGTGFSPRDITPEAAEAVFERRAPGIPEAMRAESMKITNKGCLSRSTAGLRGKSLIITLPGSKKASTENLRAVLDPIKHGLDMLYSAGSADCAAPEIAAARKEIPSMEVWLQEAKRSPDAGRMGMILTHNGVVRADSRAKVREGKEDDCDVSSMQFSYDADLAEQAKEDTLKMPGIYFVKYWMNEGLLSVGDDIMYVMIGGDTRPHVVDALQFMVGTLKESCVKEKENF